MAMTLERALALKPGDNLFWLKKPQKEIDEEEEAYLKIFGKKLPAIGCYPEELFGKSYGNPVKFVNFRYSQKNNVMKIDLDINDLPIIYVETKNGNHFFSSGHFE